jgi:simple sugar transport system ATP-binding protein
MKKLRSEGLAILFVTHFLDQVYAVSDQITVLRNGQLVGTYAAAELSRLRLVEAMLGRSAQPKKQAESRSTAEDNSPQSTGHDLALKVTGAQCEGVVGPLDFEIQAGQVVGLAGLLGSGRTETARMLFGIDPADAGRIEVAGKTAELASPRDAIAHQIAYCPEDRKHEGILPDLSVTDNIVLALQASRGAKKLSDGQRRKLAKHYIEALGIKTPSANSPIKNLSGGNQQKVLLARWLATKPKLIILDDPTRGIDVGAKAEIEALIEELREDGLGVIMISSELDELVRNCSKVVVLRDRKQVGTLEGDDISEDRVMHAIAQSDAADERPTTNDDPDEPKAMDLGQSHA